MAVSKIQLPPELLKPLPKAAFKGVHWRIAKRLMRKSLRVK